MGTQSTTSLLKENIADILKMEGQPLSIPTIREKLQARGITDYRQGHLAGSLHQILDMPGYISPERGCYQYIGGAPSEKPAYSPTDRLFEVYSRAVKEASDIVNGIDIISSTEDDLREIMTLRDIVKETQLLLDRIGALSSKHANHS
ncbi:hypothetical protein B5F07_17135 [Lachnoclostridium sp. An169]|uniref:hypothetical protein n=1 Tax=Lachnoclostridium sp. An169 TaxID=1965569 RepID=UPI000B38A921|nr:hypothetical protein [Lachnoclostridium sp. An169]OUP81540.1 hypothetical protein B5F07_17135 [Lachnoclostridium sp. An169]